LEGWGELHEIHLGDPFESNYAAGRFAARIGGKARKAIHHPRLVQQFQEQISPRPNVPKSVMGPCPESPAPRRAGRLNDTSLGIPFRELVILMFTPVRNPK
jgi:hypothetical protein